QVEPSQYRCRPDGSPGAGYQPAAGCPVGAAGVTGTSGLGVTDPPWMKSPDVGSGAGAAAGWLAAIGAGVGPVGGGPPDTGRDPYAPGRPWSPTPTSCIRSILTSRVTG